MKLHVYPTEDRVAVLPDPIERETDGGLVKPDMAIELPLRGTVYAVGPGRTTESGFLIVPRFKKGDRVAFGAYSGTPLPVAGSALLVFRAHDLLAVLVEEAETEEERAEYLRSLAVEVEMR